jgi:hypothetical protein
VQTNQKLEQLADVIKTNQELVQLVDVIKTNQELVQLADVIKTHQMKSPKLTEKKKDWMNKKTP